MNGMYCPPCYDWVWLGVRQRVELSVPSQQCLIFITGSHHLLQVKPCLHVYILDVPIISSLLTFILLDIMEVLHIYWNIPDAEFKSFIDSNTSGHCVDSKYQHIAMYLVWILCWDRAPSLPNSAIVCLNFKHFCDPGKSVISHGPTSAYIQHDQSNLSWHHKYEQDRKQSKDRFSIFDQLVNVEQYLEVKGSLYEHHGMHANSAAGWCLKT